MKAFKPHRLALGFFCIAILMLQSGCSGNPSVCDSDIAVSNTSAATLYYPCAISEPLPATTLTSGNAAPHRVLKWMAEKMVSNGFVVLAMTPTDVFGKNEGWRDAHLAGIAELERLNSAESPLKNKIDMNRLQVCGHSKGGGGALLASNILGSKLKSTIVMAPWYEDIDSLDGIKSPTLFQTGGKDIYVTRKMAMGEYDMLPSNISKAYFEYKSANHFSWGVLNLGLLHDTLGSDVLAWMKYYLKNDVTQRSKLLESDEKTANLWEDKSDAGHKHS